MKSTVAMAMAAAMLLSISSVAETTQAQDKPAETKLPWTTDGLSLLERRVLRALERGPLAFPELFKAVREEPAFLADAVLAWHLERLQYERLLEGWGKQWRSKDWRLSGKSRSQRVPRWLGGYQVRDASLRWDPASGAVVS